MSTGKTATAATTVTNPASVTAAIDASQIPTRRVAPAPAQLSTMMLAAAALMSDVTALTVTETTNPPPPSQTTGAKCHAVIYLIHDITMYMIHTYVHFLCIYMISGIFFISIWVAITRGYRVKDTKACKVYMEEKSMERLLR